MKWVSITTDKPKHVYRLNVYKSIHVTWSEIHRNCRWLLNINESLVVPLWLFNFITIYWVLNLLNYKNLLLVSSKVVEIQFLMLIIPLQSQWKKTFWLWHFVRPEKLMFHFFEAFEVEWRNLDHFQGKILMGAIGWSFHSNSCKFCHGFLQAADLCVISDERSRKLCIPC